MWQDGYGQASRSQRGVAGRGPQRATDGWHRPRRGAPRQDSTPDRRMADGARHLESCSTSSRRPGRLRTVHSDRIRRPGRRHHPPYRRRAPHASANASLLPLGDPPFLGRDLVAMPARRYFTTLRTVGAGGLQAGRAPLPGRLAGPPRLSPGTRNAHESGLPQRDSPRRHLARQRQAKGSRESRPSAPIPCPECRDSGIALDADHGRAGRRPHHEVGDGFGIPGGPRTTDDRGGPAGLGTPPALADHPQDDPGTALGRPIPGSRGSPGHSTPSYGRP